MKRLTLCMLLLGSVSALAPFTASGQAPPKPVAREDLSDCKLRNGIQELPDFISFRAREMNGYIFDFASGRLAYDPLTTKKQQPETFKEYRDAVLKERTGDICFSIGEDKAMLIAFSGKIKDLGERYLYEFNGVELPDPEEVSIELRKEKWQGVAISILPGRCYLVKTLDGKLVLLRILALSPAKRTSTIQWVVRRDEAKTFEIPKSKLIAPDTKEEELEAIRERARLEAAQAKPFKTPELRQLELKQLENRQQMQLVLDLHIANQKALTKALMDVLDDEKADNAVRATAARAMGQMRAVEAIPILCRRIDLRDANALKSEATIKNTYPCVVALIEIGKPSSHAASDYLIQLRSDDTDRVTTRKRELFTLVIVKVEGEDVANFLLEKAIEDQKQDAAKKNLLDAKRLIQKVKGWM